jgi:hypothetical protein
MKLKAPLSVTILCLVVGLLSLLGLCSSPMSLLPYFVDFGVPNPAVALIKDDPFLFPYMVASLGIGLVLNVVVLVCCAGSLMLKWWGRLGLLAYSVIALVLWAVGLVVTITVMMPKFTSSGDPAMAAGAYGGLFGSCIGLVMPVVILIVMLLPSVREAFEHADDPEPEPVDRATALDGAPE